MKCILCSSEKYKRLCRIGDFEIKKCLECGLVKTFGKQKINYQKYHRDQDYEIHKKLFRNIFKNRFNLVNQYKKSGKVLDIGASTGTMLDIFQEAGWQTWGVEPSGSADFAKDKGHKIIKATFEKARLPKNYFDVVIINHTLEHLTNPLLVLKKINRVLKKGGIVYVDVPNFGSLSAQIMKQRWDLLIPNEHLFHFTSGSLKKLMTKAGFQIIKSRTQSGLFDVESPFKHYWIKLSSFRPYLYKSLIKDCLSIPGNILATSINKGASLAMVGRKR